MMTLYIAAENISAGDEVLVQPPSEYAYRVERLSTEFPCRIGLVIGKAVEGLREGFRIRVDNGEVREDDA